MERPSPPPPLEPGCYIFRGRGGRPLYVGKAKELRRRVHQYFQNPKRLPEKIQRMMEQAKDVEWVVTGSEYEALVLENNLIKQFRPRYNTLLKDDKSYPYMTLSVGDEYPRIAVVRNPKAGKGILVFGPFIPGWRARSVLRLMQRYFHVATCSVPFDGTVRRPCLHHQMGHCPAPCVSEKVTPEAYGRLVHEAKYFLEGKTRRLRALLKARMDEYSRTQHYEDAARYRDLLRSAESLSNRQEVALSAKGWWEAFLLTGSGTQRLMHVYAIRDGRVVDRKRFSFDDVEIPKNNVFLTAMVRQYYGNTSAIPDRVLLSHLPPKGDDLERFLSDRKSEKVQVLKPQRGAPARLMKTLSQGLELEWSTVVDRGPGLILLGEALSIAGPLHRIEGFDISHGRGRETVGSLVVAIDGKPTPREYRSFRVRGGAPGDDFAAMAEVISRRYSRVLVEGGEKPDLILVDGGKGQVSVAAAVMEDLELSHIPLVGLAKKEEEIWVKGKKDPIVLSPAHAGLRILQTLRDEAHRRAISHHRKRRRRSILQGRLERIPGIGPQRSKALLRYFGSLKGVQGATEDELANHVGPATARVIRAYFSGSEVS